MTLAIITGTDAGFDREAFKALFREYSDFINIDLGFQDFEKELRALPGKYQPDRLGQLYVATWNHTPVGCAGIYQLQPTICELKRLYVKPEYQGLRIGRALMDRAICDARQFGYRQMVLDSLRRMESARELYKKMGFCEIALYNQNPYSDAYYMALDLKLKEMERAKGLEPSA